MTIVLVLLAAGCGPGEGARLVGTWKADEPDLGKTYMVWEFTAAGSYTVTRIDPTPGPGKERSEVVSGGTFQARLGDTVTFNPDRKKYPGGPTRATEKIAVDGDKMTIGDGTEKTIRLTRVTGD